MEWVCWESRGGGRVKMDGGWEGWGLRKIERHHPNHPGQQQQQQQQSNFNQSIDFWAAGAGLRLK